MRSILLGLSKGWNAYFEPRFEEISVNNEIKVEPHQVDGLSWPMTLVRLVSITKMFSQMQIDIIVMGGSAKGEERIFCNTNYFEELTNFFPDVTFMLWFAGPELSESIHKQTVVKNARLKAYFYRGTTSDFLLNFYNDLCHIQQCFKKESTLFIGFNPGFGSGYDKLLLSWSLDLVFLINLGYKIVFTQANDFSDLRGELRVFDKLFDKKVNMFLQPQSNPFSAMTCYVDENEKTNAKEGIWCSANSELYGLQGWVRADPDG